MTANRKRQVERWVRKWMRRTLLASWTHTLGFSDLSHPDSTADDPVYVSVTPDTTYTALHVTVHPEFWTISDGEQEKWLLHELIHGPVAPLGEMAQRAARRRLAIREDAERAEETLVQWITNVVWKAYQ